MAAAEPVDEFGSDDVHLAFEHATLVRGRRFLAGQIADEVLQLSDVQWAEVRERVHRLILLDRLDRDAVASTCATIYPRCRVLCSAALRRSGAMGDCLACDLSSGAVPLPGGVIFETSAWRVEHCVGPLGVGTLVVKPKRHALHVSDLSALEALEMGPVLHRTATAVRDLTPASQVYVCLWSHGPVHIHYVVQPALPDVVAEFGVYGPRMQAAMFARGGSVDPTGAAAFAERATRWFTEHPA